MSILEAASWVAVATTIGRKKVRVAPPERFRLNGLTVVRVSDIEAIPERPLSVRGVWNPPIGQLPTKWRGHVVSKPRYKAQCGQRVVVEPDPKLGPLYAACGPTPSVQFPQRYLGDPDWHADWTAELRPYERGLRTFLYGVTDAKAHESWKQRGFEGRDKKAMAAASLPLDATKLNSEGEAYGRTTWLLERQTYREWLNEVSAGDPARQLGSFVRALAVLVEAARVDRPRWLPLDMSAPPVKSEWQFSKDEIGRLVDELASDIKNPWRAVEMKANGASQHGIAQQLGVTRYRTQRLHGELAFAAWATGKPPEFQPPHT